MKIDIRLYGFILLILVVSCNDPEIPDPFTPPICTETYTPKVYDFQVVGFYPHYRQNSLPPSAIKWNRLTRVIYTFAIPDANGNPVVSIDPLTGNSIYELKEVSTASGTVLPTLGLMIEF